MTRALAKVFTGPPSPTSILVVACFVLLVTLAGGGLVHFQTQQVIAGSNMVARSQEIILSITNASRSLEQFEYQVSIYRAVNDRQHLEEARRNEISVEATLTHLHSLPDGNIKRTPQFENLSGMIALIDGQLIQSSLPYDLLITEVEKCRQLLEEMAEQEQHLLGEHRQRTQHRSSILLCSEAGILCFTFLLGLMLLVLLLCTLSAQKEAKDLSAANLAALRRQAKDLKIFKSSMDEHQLTAVLQTISQSVANDLVAYDQTTSDAPPTISSAQKPILASEEQAQIKKILVVDDDPMVRMALTARLQFYGYRVVTATDVSSALTTATAEMPDLVILDLCLPDGDGFVFMERMKKMPALDGIPVIMLSGSDLDEKRQYTLKTLSISFFQKGQQNRDFLKVIQHALKERLILPSAFISQ